jgi:hypothetical protein
MTMPLDVAGVAEILTDAIRPVLDRLRRLEARAGELETLAGALRERCAVLETRAPVPGPAGAAGADGKAGVDGLGLEELGVTYDGERTITITATAGERSKTVGVLKLPIPLDRGVYKLNAAYERGDLVSHDGSGWICKADTTAQPGTDAGAATWRLFVQRGKPGKS